MENKTGIFLVLIFVTAVQCQNQNMLKCGSLTEGEIAFLDLTVDSATFADCDAGPNSVTCGLRPLFGATNVLCVQSVTQCNTVETTDGCKCLNKQGTTYTYKLKFNPQSMQKGGNITCSVDCTIIPAPGKQEPVVTSSSECLNIEYVDLCKGYDCNGGICYIQKRTANCDCPNGYTGDHCQELNSLLIPLICVSTLLGVVMAAGGAGVYCARKQMSGGQQNAPPADAPSANAPLANAPQVNDPRYNTPPDNAPPDNAPPDNAPPDNAPPDNAPQVPGSVGSSTGQTVQTTPHDEPDESSVAGSEASEGTEVSDV